MAFGKCHAVFAVRHISLDNLNANGNSFLLSLPLFSYDRDRIKMYKGYPCIAVRKTDGGDGMDNLLLIFLVFATFILGYYAIKKVDDVLDANDSCEHRLSMLPEEEKQKKSIR